MFEAKLLQVGVLKKILEAVKDLVTAANFDCSNAGLGLHAMDSSHIALVSLMLRSDAFEHFRCDMNRSLGVSIGNLSKLLKCCDNNEIVYLRAENGKDKISFSIENPENRRLSKFEMSLMEIDAEQLSIPDTSYSVNVSMPSAEFSRVIRDLSSIGDSILIAVNKSGVTFSTSGDIGNAEVTLSPYTGDMETDEISIEMNKSVALPFASKYLSSFTKATPLSHRVLLRLADGQPLAVEYLIEDIGHITYYLAPKIQDEEMEEDED